MPRLIDLTGRKFSQLSVVKKVAEKRCRTKWICLCECGKQVEVFSQGLIRGITKNCGSTETHVSTRGGSQYRYHGLANTRKYKMYMAAKERSKRERIPFTLTLSQMPDIPEKCPVFGFTLESGGRGRGLRDRSPSLDKIVPEKGYIAGNVQIISGKANKMKSNATTEEIGKLYRFMLRVDSQEGDCELTSYTR